MGMAHRGLFLFRRPRRRHLFSGFADRSIWQVGRSSTLSPGLLYCVPVHRDQRVTLDRRSPTAAALLAYADRIEHLSANVQVLVADVDRLLGADDIRHLRLRIFSGSARRR